MVICQKCGVKNPLGRVFCMSCGMRLNLTHMTRDTVAKMQKRPWTDYVSARRVVPVLVALVLACGGLAVWPRTEVIGKSGASADHADLQNQLVALMGLRTGQSLRATFAEAGLNAYLRNYKTKRLKLESFSVAILPGYVSARVVRVLGPFKLASFEFSPKVSYDIVCRPAGNRLALRKASVGHLRLFGPARTFASGKVLRLLANEKEWALVKDASEITAEEGRLSLLVKK